MLIVISMNDFAVFRYLVVSFFAYCTASLYYLAIQLFKFQGCHCVLMKSVVNCQLSHALDSASTASHRTRHRARACI